MPENVKCLFIVVNAAGSDDIVKEDIRLNADHFENGNSESHNEEMDYEDQVQAFNRQLVTDSDSDCAVSAHCTKLKPAPHLPIQRKAEKKTAKASDKPPSK